MKDSSTVQSSSVVARLPAALTEMPSPGVTRLSAAFLVLACLLLFTACGGGQKKTDPAYGIEPNTPEGAAMAAFVQGDTAEAANLVASAGNGAKARFVRAEVAYYQGDVEAAYDEWFAILAEHPDDPLTRVASARLFAARDQVVKFEQRTLPLFERIEYAKLDPVTRMQLGLLRQTVAYRLWKRSPTDQPFDADSYGFPTRWLMTPTMSPWRLRDFDVSFAPEKEGVLRAEYLSPHTATDLEQNYEPVEPYWAGGLTLYPRPGADGVVYLETFATVEGKKARDFWIYGNFVAATTVWIDGVRAIERSEGDYESGRRMRKVRLTPGTHRVLVKMAYQSGYRDWFDLMLLPVSGGVDESGVDFAYGCMADRKLPDCHDGGATDGATAKMLDEPKTLAELEPIWVTPEQAREATDAGLWVTALAAHYDGHNDTYAAVWDELASRHPKFAAGYSLYADHVQTLWQVPSRLRDARGLKALRHAYEIDPDSIKFAAELGAWLTKQGDEDEARALLEKARDGALVDGDLRAVRPLASWAALLSSKDWTTEAEAAWRAVLEVEPGNCRAASEVQSALYARGDYVPPAKITPAHELCPALDEAWVAERDLDDQGRLRLARREAGRSPLRGDIQVRYARALRELGQDDEADAVLATARDRSPDSAAVWSDQAERLYGAGDEVDAIALFERYRQVHGNSAWLEWKLATLTGDIPLTDLMPDGRAAAMKVVSESQDKSLSNDDAYFAVDFAARKYYPDGSKITLTHTVVRVMTKGAIDRYGEQNIPGDARVIQARTIKQDGSVRVPEQTAGKATLSMPGLAEGDFVEIAYIEWDGPETPASHVEGVRFFFRMQNISTLHSEYVVIGDIAEFMRVNDAPQLQRFEYEGEPAVRFLAKNNPRPRDEPASVSIEEYLPWVQMYRQGQSIDDLEAYRRDTHEDILDSSKTDRAFDEMYARWTKVDEEKGSLEWLKAIYYNVAAFIPDPSIGPRSFNTDVNHAVLQKEGNTMLVLKVVLDRLGVENDVYVARSAYQIPEQYPIRERFKYGDVLLRAVVPATGEPVWLYPAGPDAMFNAVGPALTGQPAICVTCEDPKREIVKAETVRGQDQSIDAHATLDAQGNLTGKIRFTFDGPSASSIRGGLRLRTDDTSRAKFADSLAAGIFPGAAATAYTIDDEKNPDEPLAITVEFVRPGFAREVGNGVWAVETALFGEAMASVYASLPSRTIPLFVSRPRHASNRLTMDVSAWKEAQLVGQAPTKDLAGPFGEYRRSVQQKDGKIVLSTEVDVPIQRVPIEQYPVFQQWALQVEQSAAFLMRLRK